MKTTDYMIARQQDIIRQARRTIAELEASRNERPAWRIPAKETASPGQTLDELVEDINASVKPFGVIRSSFY